MDQPSESSLSNDIDNSELNEDQQRALDILKKKGALLEAYTKSNETNQTSPEDQDDGDFEAEDYLAIITEHLPPTKTLDKTRSPYKTKHVNPYDLWKANKVASKHAREAVEISDSLQTLEPSEINIVTEVSPHYYSMTKVDTEFIDESKTFCPSCNRRVDTQLAYNYNSCTWMTAFACCLIFPFLVIFAWLPFLLSHQFHETMVICCRCGAVLEDHKAD
ncbi:hypothetical protein CDAR_519761 [Caerostris darwini]|uniref:LITAF domain-containing protein n=1 Tax=Caerostris darwini TaxID=1538125 RepID=A0AAV4TI26_9ARAC|nr:hypothetical protein CDAR_519761 [Caerostris darwini]